jgi:hypothetical protein
LTPWSIASAPVPLIGRPEMGEILPFPPAPPHAAPEAPQAAPPAGPAVVIPLPTPITADRRWLKNVAARMAAGVVGYGVNDLRRAIAARHAKLGPHLDRDAADLDEACSLDYALKVRDGILAILAIDDPQKAPPPRRGPSGGRAA